ncbi:MAG: thiol reductant ABC exporter subunit CydD [Anaerolineaceae bacterium]|nr:thiol reductant ABC exporter subunit CydD [Anaerolineaceae bacterium]
MKLDLRLLRYARQEAWRLGMAVTCGLGVALLGLLQAYQLSAIITGVFLEGEGLLQVRPVLAALLGVVLARAALTFLGEGAAATAAARIKTRLRDMLYEHLFALGPGYTQGEKSAELATTAVEGIEALDAYIAQYLPQVALAGLIPLTYLVAVFPLDLVSGVILLLTAPLIPVFMILIGSISESLTRRQWTSLSRMSAFFLDTLQGLLTLKALGQSQVQSQRIENVSEQHRRATLSVLRVTFLSALVLELVGTISTALIAVQVGLRLLYGHMPFEQAFFLLVIAPDFYLPLRNLGLRFHAGMNGVAAAERIFTVLNQPVKSALPGQTEPAGEGKTGRSSVGVPAPVFNRLRFERVAFTYPGRERAALQDVSFSILCGQQVALVGTSGAGKSTLAALLLRFYEPDAGAIWVDERRLQDISLEEWRQQLAWVPQQPYLFNASIEENLALGRRDADPAAIRAAARAALLEEWIAGLPDGYQTRIGADGERISGGEGQRLALARAFLKDAPLLVMDEPTAHLDPENEDLLLAATRRLRQDRTVVMIAHRLSTVLQADLILVLEGGQIVQSGGYHFLASREGAFRRYLDANWSGR